MADVAEQATERVSFEAFLALETPPHAEWVDGRLIPMSPPSSRHQQLVIFLASCLRAYAEARELGEVMVAPFLMRLDQRPSGREPDVLFVARENLSRLGPQYLDGPADLVIEVISPESRARDRGEKFYEYEAAGVPEYWLVDYEREQAECYQRDERGIYQPAPLTSGRYESRALPGLTLETAWLWQTPPPKLLTILRSWRLLGNE
jgi:Uma2 family endonuclease